MTRGPVAGYWERCEMAMDEDLQRMAKHVDYERWMFVEAIRQLASEPRLCEHFQHCLLLEAALTHARVLHEFLFRPISPKYPKDVRAGHFFDNPDQWNPKQPEIAKLDFLRDDYSRDRVDKALAHLSTERLEFDANPNWELGAIANGFQTAWQYFLCQLPEERRIWFHCQSVTVASTSSRGTA